MRVRLGTHENSLRSRKIRRSFPSSFPISRLLTILVGCCCGPIAAPPGHRARVRLTALFRSPPNAETTRSQASRSAYPVVTHKPAPGTSHILSERKTLGLIAETPTGRSGTSGVTELALAVLPLRSSAPSKVKESATLLDTIEPEIEPEIEPLNIFWNLALRYYVARARVSRSLGKVAELKQLAGTSDTINPRVTAFD